MSIKNAKLYHKDFLLVVIGHRQCNFAIRVADAFVKINRVGGFVWPCNGMLFPANGGAILAWQCAG